MNRRRRWKSGGMPVSMVILAGVVAAGCQSPPRIEKGGRVTVRDAGRPVMTAVLEPAPCKPYVKELYTPGGVQVLLDSPHDHVHHHGLMFAIGAGEVEYWSEVPADKFGRQVPRPEATRVGRKSIGQSLDWTEPGGAVRLNEQRWVSLSPSSSRDATVVTWKTALLVPDGGPAIRLWGRHYFGLGLRLVRDLDEKAEFVLPPGTGEGRLVRSDECLRAAAWCAARGAIGGKPVTVAMFSHPANQPHPAVFFTMTKPFAYLGATLDLEAAPRELKPGETLSLRYGVALWDGAVDEANIESAYRAWLSGLR